MHFEVSCCGCILTSPGKSQENDLPFTILCWPNVITLQALKDKVNVQIYKIKLNIYVV